jgi:hypothetical protein
VCVPLEHIFHSQSTTQHTHHYPSGIDGPGHATGQAVMLFNAL